MFIHSFIHSFIRSFVPKLINLFFISLTHIHKFVSFSLHPVMMILSSMISLMSFLPPGTCPLMYPRAHMLVNTVGTAIGTNVSFHCEDGYHLVGAANTVCLNTGNWSAATPSCVLGCTWDEQGMNKGVDSREVGGKGGRCQGEMKVCRCRQEDHVRVGRWRWGDEGV